MATSSANLPADKWTQLRAGIALVLCAVLNGCIGATPLPKRTPEGTEVKNVD